MFIAERLRKENIAEYLLYMWHIEDLIRAFGLSLSRIQREYISQFQYDEEHKEELVDWYGDIIHMMNSEGKREHGHVRINEIVLQQMADLHNRLLQSDRFSFYTAEYYRVLPIIVELRQKHHYTAPLTTLENPTEDRRTLPGEIETCMNALYGVMMLRLQKKTITSATNTAIKEITTFIGMLSDYFKKDKVEDIFA